MSRLTDVRELESDVIATFEELAAAFQLHE